MEEEPFVAVDLSAVSSEIVNVPTQNMFIDQLVDTMTYFFGKGDHSFAADYPAKANSTNFPFKGFILYGPPGSGKTEAVKQAAQKLWKSLELDHGLEVRLFHINSANIFTKELGALEKRMKRVFTVANSTNQENHRTIILFDDIDTLLTKRTDNQATEWSKSLNGVLFHELDKLVTSRVMVVGTTNLRDAIDDAVTSRLSLRPAPAPTLDEMKQVAETALPIRGSGGKTFEDLLRATELRIDSEIKNGTPPSFRLARRAAIETVIGLVTGWEGEQ
jgi:SpoVK/Ycf46/Vps4 family AAA+-type ATPase